MRITSKGQVTIPNRIRQQLGLLPETEVEFEVEGDAVRIRRSRRPEGTGRGAATVARLKGRGAVQMTTDQILALTRGKVKADR